MATPIKEVTDLMILTLQDYKLTNLKKINAEAYEEILNAFVIKGKSKFKKCKQSLEYDEVNKVFLSDLTDEEKDILSEFGSIMWFTREVQNVLAFNAKLSNKEFKTYSEAQNLKEKKDYLLYLQEKVQQDILEYVVEDKVSWEGFKM